MGVFSIKSTEARLLTSRLFLAEIWMLDAGVCNIFLEDLIGGFQFLSLLGPFSTLRGCYSFLGIGLELTVFFCGLFVF